jgi:hypothetical protein
MNTSEMNLVFTEWRSGYSIVRELLSMCWHIFLLAMWWHSTLNLIRYLFQGPFYSLPLLPLDIFPISPNAPVEGTTSSREKGHPIWRSEWPLECVELVTAISDGQNPLASRVEKETGASVTTGAPVISCLLAATFAVP